MKPLFLFFICLGVFSSLLAQQDIPADSLFRKFKPETDYIGGKSGYQKHLNKNLRYPIEAIQKDVSGDVVLHVTIDTSGAVYDSEVASGPEFLRNESVRVINLAKGFIPDIVNGKKVTTYRSITVVFRIEK